MDLMNKTLAELRVVAKEKGIAGISKMKKDELIEVLSQQNTKEDNNTSFKINNEEDQIAEGILEVMPDGFGFLRGENYLSSNKDVYVSPVQIRRFKLDTGDKIKGICRIPKEGEKFPALIFVGEVNGDSPDNAAKRKRFDELTPLYPDERIRLETKPIEFSMRLIDLIAPIGKGQRGLIVAPPKAR